MGNYDLIISLGGDYITAMALKLLEITEKTYPFDWTVCDGDASERLLKNCTIIKKRFENEFNIDDFIKHHSSETFMRGIKNTRSGICYAQDFTLEQSVKDFFPNFAKTYQRRIKRLYDDIEKANNILFVYQDLSAVLPLNTIKKAKDILQESFPNKNINLFVFLPLISTKTALCHKTKTNIDNTCLFACTNQWPENHEKRLDLFGSVLQYALNKASYPNADNITYSAFPDTD